MLFPDFSCNLVYLTCIHRVDYFIIGMFQLPFFPVLPLALICLITDYVKLSKKAKLIALQLIKT